MSAALSPRQMSDNLIERSNGLLEGVTDGPWEVVWETEEMEYGVGARYAYAIHGPADLSTLEARHISDEYKAQYGHQITEIVGLSDADAEFIAGARSLVPELVAEVERLRAMEGRVRMLAESWRYSGQFGWGPWQEGHGPDPEGQVLDNAAGELLKAVSGE